MNHQQGSMNRQQRFLLEELDELLDLLIERKSEELFEDVLNKIPTHLLGVVIDYGFGDKEVVGWIDRFVSEEKKNAG